MIWRLFMPFIIKHTVGFSAPVDAGSADDGVAALAGTSGRMLGPDLQYGGGIGVYGASGTGVGVYGLGKTAGHFETNGSQGAVAIEALNTADADVIVATSSSPNHAALSGTNNSGGYGAWVSSMTNPGAGTTSKGGIGLYARGATFAAVFDGDVQVNQTLNVVKDITLTAGAGDCAEDFDVSACAEIDPGTVVVLTESGALEPSQNAYDKKVAGVISGAGDYRPAMILDRKEAAENRMPLALVGKVFCKVDAGYGPIEVGDLLTTSPTVGYAMKAADPSRAFGAVIGKALRSLPSGRGVVPVLIALQ
jgi:hypothetical protein